MSARFHPYLCGRNAAEWLIDMKEQADNIILESLNYSKRMLASVISVIIFIIGIAFIISPLFLVSQSYIWTLGLIIVAIAILYIYTRKKRNSMKATNRAYHLSALALQGIALILEILPGVRDKSNQTNY